MLYFTCPIDANVTPHSTLKLKMALEYEIVMGGGGHITLSTYQRVIAI